MSGDGDLIRIGVDGGGTGCRVAVGTRLAGVLACAQGGPANVATDPQQAITNIISTVAQAAHTAGMTSGQMQCATAYLGLAGVLSAKDSTRIAAALPYAHSAVSDDRPTAITGALGGKDGYLLAVGTGTIIASSINATFDCVGGWGFHVSDQASGAWLGRAALEQVLLCHDGLETHTDLTRTLFAQFGDDPNEIVAFSLSAKPADFGTLTPDIVAGAKAGDDWGRTLMMRGAEYLVRGLAKLGCHAGDTLCLSGGLGPFYAPYLPADMLIGQTDPIGSALDGAFALATLGGANSPKAT